MRGDEQLQSGLILMTTLEDVVPDDHPLRAIRRLVDSALAEMSPTLDALYASRGRPSIAPEYLLRAQLVQILYAIPSERRLCEELRYNLLLRWFVGLPLDEPVFHPTSFTKNRDRLLTSEVAEAFFEAIRAQAEAHKLLSREHFSLDGTLLEAAASLKSLRPIEQGGRRATASAAAATGASTSTASGAANATHRSTHRPRRPPGEDQGQGGQALLRRPPALREPPRPDRRVRAHAGERHGRARGRPAPAGQGTWPPGSQAPDRGRR